jgi:type IV pilus assembly protein PilB
MVPPPHHLAGAIAGRLKAMANLDMAERRRSQHWRIEQNIAGNPVFMRVSVLPTVFGEHIAVRVFDRSLFGLDLKRLGMGPDLLARLGDLIRNPSGTLLVTGPSGSGKTTTLYSALNELNAVTDKIITAEDPVECDIDGIVQCQVCPGETPADVVRALLGQDPDVLAVGEIRDPQTAEAAVQAVLGGRLVLSTLEADDTASAITRLCGMGLESSVIAASVKGILAQRLVRKICENCRTELEPIHALQPVVSWRSGVQSTFSMSGNFQLLSRIAFFGPYTRNHGNHFCPAGV